MPRIPLPDTKLIVDLPDMEKNGVTIKRKALSHTTQIEDIDRRVVMHVQVVYYGDNNEPLNAPGIQPYMRMLIADNNTLADADTGLPICLTKEEFIGEGEDKHLNPLLEGKNYAPQFDLFDYMQTQPVVINDMKRGHILNAHALGRLD